MARAVFTLVTIISLISLISLNNSTLENNERILSNPTIDNNETNSNKNKNTNTNPDTKTDKVEEEKIALKAPERSLLITVKSYLIERMNFTEDSMLKKTFLMDIILILLSHGANEEQTELLKEFTLAATKDFPDEIQLNNLGTYLEEKKMLNLMTQIYLKDRLKRERIIKERKERREWRERKINTNKTNTNEENKNIENQENKTNKTDL
jgi:hypothetical protein